MFSASRLLACSNPKRSLTELKDPTSFRDSRWPLGRNQDNARHAFFLEYSELLEQQVCIIEYFFSFLIALLMFLEKSEVIFVFRNKRSVAEAWLKYTSVKI